MIQQSVVCDICGAVKREVNQWWVISASWSGFTIVPGRGAKSKLPHDGNAPDPFDPGAVRMLDVCSQGCASVAMEKWMTKIVKTEKENHERREPVGEAHDQRAGALG